MADEEKPKPEETEKEGTEIETTEDGKIQIPEVTRAQVKKEMPKIEGVVFKIGDFYFRVSYLNIGQRRFSAEMINDLKE